MYIMYVDESGDPGLENSPTRYFALSGLVIHELRWNTYIDQIIDFRRRLRKKFDLKLREEIHAGKLITHPKELSRIPKNDRLAIIRMCADELSSMPEISLINILNDKANKAQGYDVFVETWMVLLQRFENTIRFHNFPGPRNPDDTGLILSDNTDSKKVIRLMRKMRKYNPVPNKLPYVSGYRNIQIKHVIEDASFRDSKDSYYIQMADISAFLLYQMITPNLYMRNSAAYRYFLRLSPILCRVACINDPNGIVRL
jgi:uncharacterized ubiquitin-like protein YukD